MMLQTLISLVTEHLQGREPAHDLLHVKRVAMLAEKLATQEGAKVSVAVTAAWLHEWVNLPKAHPDSARSGELCAIEAAAVLRRIGWPEEEIADICDCIHTHSFSRGLSAQSLEAKILQDADRLDAIGAIGIARCFATCADMKTAFYAEVDPFCRERGPDDKRFGIDHFFRKLLLLPAQMHTESARQIAAHRLQVMQSYLFELEQEICR